MKLILEVFFWGVTNFFGGFLYHLKVDMLSKRSLSAEVSDFLSKFFQICAVLQ